MESKETLYHFLKETVEKYGDRPAARAKIKKEWTTFNYNQWNDWIQELSLGLMDMGFDAGEKIVHIADNRLEWMIVSLAITSIGCVDVPRGTDATNEDLEFIINHTEASVLILENEKVYNKLAADWSKFPNLKTLIIVEGNLPATPGKATMTLADVREKGKQAKKSGGLEPYHKRGLAVKDDDLATIIYTSGTTGSPKGVMLANTNLVWETHLAVDVLGLRHTDGTMCFLPPWHIAERLLEQGMIKAGACCNFTQVPTIREDMAHCKPTIFLAVPRVWEGFYNKIHDTASKGSPAKVAIFNFGKKGAMTKTMALQYIKGLVAYSEKPGLREFLKRPGYLLCLPFLLIWGGLGYAILGGVRNLLGGQVRLAFSGAGALPHNVDLFFRACGVPIAEAYGMTETTGVSTFRLPRRNKFQTLGPPAPGVDMELRTESGEVIKQAGVKGIAWHKGPHIMKGYYKEPEKTKAVMDDRGFLNSGDLLIRTQTGEYRFAGRAKDTIVLLGGENLEPGPIEDKLKESIYISSCMVVGQDRKTLGLIITPNTEALLEWAQNNGQSLPSDQAHWNQDAELRSLYKSEIKNLISNQNGFKSFEKISNFHILHKDFEAGVEMTQTMKIKRNVVADLYEKEIDALYK